MSGSARITRCAGRGKRRIRAASGSGPPRAQPSGNTTTTTSPFLAEPGTPAPVRHGGGEGRDTIGPP
ncbi:hypothetical protein ABK046_08710 [Streptomyces caeruleatus]